MGSDDWLSSGLVAVPVRLDQSAAGRPSGRIQKFLLHYYFFDVGRKQLVRHIRRGCG